VDPSHVRNQTGSFGDALARLIKKKALTMDKEQSFRDALTDAFKANTDALIQKMLRVGIE
jgi:hypothetical protein